MDEGAGAGGGLGDAARRSPASAVTTAMTGAGDGDQASIDRLCRAIVDVSPYLFCVIERDGRFRYVSPGALDIVGYEPVELLGRNAFDHVHPDDLEVAAEALHQIDEEFEDRPGAGVPMAIRLRHKDGTMVYVEVGTTPMFEDPDVQGFIVRARPMTGQQFLDRALEALVESSPLDDVLDFLAASLNHEMTGSSAAIAFAWNGEGFTRSVSAGLPELLAGSAGGALRGPWNEVLPATDLVVYESLDGLPDGVAAQASALGFEAVWILPVSVPPDDALLACVTVWREVPGAPWVSHAVSLDRVARLTALAFERRHSEDLLRHAALHDTLTGLANRAQFFERLESLPSPAEGAVVLYLDLDSFKPVNDTFGHSAGDLVLQTVTDRMLAAVRSGDLVARLGGDEFAVLCPSGTGRDQAVALASRLIDVVSEPIEVSDGEAVSVGVSVGIALGDSEPPIAMLDAADDALYAAKVRGKGRWHMGPG